MGPYVGVADLGGTGLWVEIDPFGETDHEVGTVPVEGGVLEVDAALVGDKVAGQEVADDTVVAVVPEQDHSTVAPEVEGDQGTVADQEGEVGPAPSKMKKNEIFNMNYKIKTKMVYN